MDEHKDRVIEHITPETISKLENDSQRLEGLVRSITEPFDICYIESDLPKPGGLLNSRETCAVFCTVYPNRTVSGRTWRAVNHNNQFVRNPGDRSITFADIPVSQLSLLCAYLSLDYFNFVEEAFFGKEKTELRRFLEELEKEFPFKKDKGILASTPFVINGHSKRTKIYFVYNKTLSCVDPPNREYGFTSYRGWKEHSGNIDLTWFSGDNYEYFRLSCQNPSLDPIRRELDEGVEWICEEYFGNVDSYDISVVDKTQMLREINNQLRVIPT